jgi:hypothetical protein
MPRPEVTKIVRNQSSRNGVKPRVIVLHSTESHERPGLSDLQGLGSWFDNGSAQASSHVGNDAEGNDARFVADDRKAWTQGQENPRCLSIEQIGFARESRKQWLDQPKQLRNTAEWIAYWSKKYGIPIRKSTQHGVCQHTDFPSQSHTDCGPGYPFDHVLSLAREIADGVVPEDVRENKWKRKLRIQRSRLARISGSIKRLREGGVTSAERDDYDYSIRAMNATKERINTLKRLIARK